MLAAPALAQTPPAAGAPQQNQQTARPPATPELRDARAAMRQACAPDIANICKDVEPGGRRIIECLRNNREHLSPGCLAAWQKLRALRSYER